MACRRSSTFSADHPFPGPPGCRGLRRPALALQRLSRRRSSIEQRPGLLGHDCIAPNTTSSVVRPLATRFHRPLRAPRARRSRPPRPDPASLRAARGSGTVVESDADSLEFAACRGCPCLGGAIASGHPRCHKSWRALCRSVTCHPRHGDRSPRRADHGARGETIGIDPARPARPNGPRSAPPRRHGFEERLFVDGGEHPLRAGSPAQVVKPGRRHRLRRGCHLRTPRSGTGAKDETRRPQTGSVCGWKGAERIMPKPSGSVRSVVITRLA